MPSRTTPRDFVTISGLPVTARIYRIDASPFWQFRFFTEGKYVRRSTDEKDKARACERAKELYKDTLLRQSVNEPVHTTTFAAATRRFVEWQETQAKLRQITQRTHKEDIYILNRHILPFFRTLDVSSITKGTLEKYLASISELELASSTINKHINVVRKVLNHALDDGLIKHLPRFPKISQDFKARPYFDLESYKKLIAVARDYAKHQHVSDYKIKGKVVRKLTYTDDFADLVEFCVQVFVRISDIKDLRHKHIRIFKKGIFSDATYLEIWPPNPKTKNTDSTSCSMAKAVQIYERLLKRHHEEGFGRPDDYVFYPKLANRDYALDSLGRLFRTLLDENGLRTDAKGRERTLYSLRHTALMFRLLYGNKINIHLLAKNALTSVQMLERFYLSHAEGAARIKELQSWGSSGAVYQLSLPPEGSPALRRARRVKEQAEKAKHKNQADRPNRFMS